MRSHGNEPRLGKLRLADGEDVTIAIDIPPAQARNLADAQTKPEQQAEDGGIGGTAKQSVVPIREFGGAIGIFGDPKTTTDTLTEIITGLLLTLFTLIFLLHGGRDIYEFVTRIFPASVRDRVRDAGRAGFGSLIGYVRATFVVAMVDAVGIGTGLAIMGVPLALPLASLVFLGAFVPLVGAVLTGFVAVVVALIAKGWIYALIALGLIIAVQQLEAHVLQPIVMGRAVSVHPLAVVLAIAGGGVMAGIIGALIAVPIVAFLNSAIRVLVASDPDAEEAELLAEAGSVAAAAVSQEGTPPATDGPPGAADPQR